MHGRCVIGWATGFFLSASISSRRPQNLSHSAKMCFVSPHHAAQPK